MQLTTLWNMIWGWFYYHFTYKKTDKLDVCVEQLKHSVQKAQAFVYNDVEYK
jgi:hypothetical protein